MHLGSKSRSLESYPPDIFDRVLKEYAAEALGFVHCLLEDLAYDLLSRCALFVAAGSPERLKKIVDIAKVDPKDLIATAEFDPRGIRIRDFSQPFPAK
jgi:hypothetical protein